MNEKNEKCSSGLIQSTRFDSKRPHENQRSIESLHLPPPLIFPLTHMGYRVLFGRVVVQGPTLHAAPPPAPPATPQHYVPSHQYMHACMHTSRGSFFRPSSFSSIVAFHCIHQSFSRRFPLLSVCDLFFAVKKGKNF